MRSSTWAVRRSCTATSTTTTSSTPARGRGHLAIDAKAMLGEPEFDVPSFLWNPLPYRMRLGETERRLAAFAAAGLDEGRMRAWAVIRGAYLGADADEVEVLRALV